MEKPQQFADAAAEMISALKELEGDHLDPISAPWGDVEKGIIKMLGGALDPENPNHQAVVFMTGALFGERLESSFDAFWFPNRSSRFGATMGLPEVLTVVSPLDVAEQALAKGDLAKLDEVQRDLRNARAKATLGLDAGTPERLGPETYQNLFDPALVQFAAFDEKAAEEVLNTTPSVIMRIFRQRCQKSPTRPTRKSRKIWCNSCQAVSSAWSLVRPSRVKDPKRAVCWKC